MNIVNTGEIRVMVADDSAVVRGLITRMINSETDTSVVESVANGRLAVRAFAQRSDIDVVILDIEMPVMDGLTALPELLKLRPGLPIVMASTLTQRNATVSLEALDAGAADYIPKPSTGSLVNHDVFRQELIRKIRALGSAWRQKNQNGNSRPPLEKKRPGVPLSAKPTSTPAVAPAQDSTNATLRQCGRFIPKVICIGCSTGGPQALLKVFQDLSPSAVKQPILVTQHMPATFTHILADRISRLSQWTCAEGQDGEVLEPGRVYVAPGEFHMVVENGGGKPRLRLNQNPPVNFCRPAVDCTFESAVSVFGGRILAVILTGMGADGCDGSRKIVSEGGTVIAQDSATSVVWGMPGAVATAGLCSAILPIGEISRSISSIANRGAA
jgi:two-component system chemotaxis response regulator CheB